MNVLQTLRSKVKLQEGSTKRGISAVVTGGIVLYLVFKGQPADVDAILQTVTGKVEFWIGIGLNVMGLLGMFIPDEPATVKVELPAIELQGRATAVVQSDRVRESGVQTRSATPLARPVRTTESTDSSKPATGWNG